MSILFVARWRGARGMISSGCASKSVGTRKSPSYLARRLATAGLQLAPVGCSHDGVHPDNPTPHGGGSPPSWLCGELLVHILPQRYTRASVRNAASFFAHFVGVRFCGGWYSHIFSGLIVLPVGGLNVRAGSMGKLIWNFMVHPLLGEEDSALSPRWL